MEYIFTYIGKPVKNIKKAFKAALINAGITDLRFHNLRHTFASQAIMRGGDLEVLAPFARAEKKGG